MNMFNERRKYQRKEASCHASVGAIDSQYVLGEGFLTNVSENGFAIETECLFPVGKKIFIKINLLNDTVFLVGEVVRTEEGFFDILYGVRICEHESVNLDFFKTYIKCHLN
jgi:hypothetical protein